MLTCKYLSSSGSSYALGPTLFVGEYPLTWARLLGTGRSWWPRWVRGTRPPGMTPPGMLAPPVGGSFSLVMVRSGSFQRPSSSSHAHSAFTWEIIERWQESLSSSSSLTIVITILLYCFVYYMYIHCKSLASKSYCSYYVLIYICYIEMLLSCTSIV